MQANEWFRIWFSSPYSDVLYRKHDKAEATMLVNKLADKLQMPAASYVLDAACGKGRYSAALAEKGFNTTGIDICAESIAEAQHNEAENLHFYLHDIRLPFYINYFDYVFNFFTSFGYFKTAREHNDAMRTLAQSLKQDGFLVIDYLNVHYSEEHLKHNETLKLEGIDFNIERWSDTKYFYKCIHVHDAAKSIDETFTEQVEKFSLGDFTDMFSYQGLKVQDVFGDYNLNTYHVKNSPRMIMIAKKIH
jgi:SAM-dependent methyltransferase